MERNSEAGKINISKSTYELVKDSLRVRIEVRQRLRGRGHEDALCDLVVSRRL